MDTSLSTNHARLLDRYRGSLVGLATGDALGAPLEFSPPNLSSRVRDMAGGGVFELEPGQWTDDTSMALCLADSLISKQAFDPVDQLERYSRWYNHGYLSSNGACFDIGLTIKAALDKFAETREPFCGPSDYYSAGNGSIMRLAPVPLFFAANPEMAVYFSGQSSRTTHQAIVAVDACRYLGTLIVGAIRGADKEQLLSETFSPTRNYWSSQPLTKEVLKVANGSFKTKAPPQIRGSGYAAQSLEAALWSFYNNDTFEEGLIEAVNLRDDADTTGAVYGQLAGAYYGLAEIPARWTSKLAKFQIIINFADRLFELAFDK